MPRPKVTDRPTSTKPRGGSRKGIPNKHTSALKDMIRTALDKAGGVRYLTQQAKENPSVFLSLVGRTLPKDVNVDSKGDIIVRIVSGVPERVSESQSRATSGVNRVSDAVN